MSKTIWTVRAFEKPNLRTKRTDTQRYYVIAESQEEAIVLVKEEHETKTIPETMDAVYVAQETGVVVCGSFESMASATADAHIAMGLS